MQDIDALSRLLQALAAQTAGLLNVSSLHNNLSISRATIDHYLAVLQRLYLVRVLPAWHSSHSKCLVKAPKVHILDSGLAASLMDLHAENWNTHRNRFGYLIESFIIQQLSAQAAWTDPDLKLFHYRDKDKVEVDCVITKGRKVWGVEVKASQSVNSSDTKGLRRLAEIAGKDFQRGIVFYTGNSTLPLGEDSFMAVPISSLWTH